jgi:hypothetical protein
MPLTTRLLALRGEVPVSPLFRDILRALIAQLRDQLHDIDLADRISIYEGRDQIYLAALAEPELMYQALTSCLSQHHARHGSNPGPALQALQLDQALCPRHGSEQTSQHTFNFDVRAVFGALAAMELPATAAYEAGRRKVTINHPGGVGEILHSADGGSWLGGTIRPETAEVDESTSELKMVAIA